MSNQAERAADRCSTEIGVSKLRETERLVVIFANLLVSSWRPQSHQG